MKFQSMNIPFVHEVDIYILMARQAMHIGYQDFIEYYLKNALSRWVVSPEVRKNLSN